MTFRNWWKTPTAPFIVAPSSSWVRNSGSVPWCGGPVASGTKEEPKPHATLNATAATAASRYFPLWINPIIQLIKILNDINWGFDWRSWTMWNRRPTHPFDAPNQIWAAKRSLRPPSSAQTGTMPRSCRPWWRQPTARSRLITSRPWKHD